MSRFTIPADINSAPQNSREMLETINKQLGTVPNIYRLVAISPAALSGFTSMAGALAKGKLSGKEREGIALSLAQLNGCSYCLSAHSYISAHMLKTDEAEIKANRKADSSDEKTKAVLEFAVKIAEKKGKVSEQDMKKLRDLGVGEAEMIEIVQNVALNIWTNYLNNMAETKVDFPEVKL